MTDDNVVGLRLPEDLQKLLELCAEKTGQTIDDVIRQAFWSYLRDTLGDDGPTPGAFLVEQLNAQGITRAELARRMGKRPEVISTLVHDRNPLTPRTALQLEKVLGISAEVWLDLKARHDLRRERQLEQRRQERQDRQR